MRVPTVAAAVMEEIRGKILKGEMKPGDKVNIDQLARDMAVSKTPIREALKELGQEGLLVYEPRVGWSVVSYPPEDFAQLHEIQRVLRTHLGNQIHRFVDGMNFEELERINDNIIHFVNTKQYDHAFLENDKFHMRIYAAYPNRILLESLRQVNNTIGLQRRFLLQRRIERDPDRYLSELKSQHREILTALETRDPDRIRRAFEGHFEALNDMLEEEKA